MLSGCRGKKVLVVCGSILSFEDHGVVHRPSIAQLDNNLSTPIFNCAVDLCVIPILLRLYRKKIELSCIVVVHWLYHTNCCLTSCGMTNVYLDHSTRLLK